MEPANLCRGPTRCCIELLKRPLSQALWLLCVSWRRRWSAMARLRPPSLMGCVPT